MGAPHAAVEWAFAQKTKTPQAKFVLIACARLVTDEWTCWPSIRHLVDVTLLSPGEARQALRHLEEAGLISQEPGFSDNGRRVSNLIRLTPPPTIIGGSKMSTPDSERKDGGAPLRRIVDRPSQLLESLECGHVLPRPLGLGENASLPSKVKRRRCWKCQPQPPTLSSSHETGAL